MSKQIVIIEIFKPSGKYYDTRQWYLEDLLSNATYDSGLPNMDIIADHIREKYRKSWLNDGGFIRCTCEPDGYPVLIHKGNSTIP